MTIQEIYRLAEENGWSIEYDNNNQLVIYTNIYEEDSDDEESEYQQQPLNFSDSQEDSEEMPNFFEDSEWLEL